MATANEAKLNGRMRLIRLQKEIKAPKNEYNDFAQFHYRTTSEILRGIKPLCDTYHLQLMTSTECVVLGWGETMAGVYQKATANVLDADNGELIAASTAMAREDNDRKKMSAPQVSASAAQFAVKRALEQLLMLDDSAPEVDAMRPVQQQPSEPVQVRQPRRVRPVQPQRPWIYDSDDIPVGSNGLPVQVRQPQPQQAAPQPVQPQPVQQPRQPRRQAPAAPVQAPARPAPAAPVQAQAATTAAAPKQAPQPAPATGGDPWAAPMPAQPVKQPTPAEKKKDAEWLKGLEQARQELAEKREQQAATVKEPTK